MQIKIATGKSRFEKKWKNIELSWSDLVDKLSITTRTAETVLEYTKMKKVQQSAVKDIGGFVGGWLANGKRSSLSVECRSLLTLDADFATTDFWETFQMLNDYTALVYSTHKHTAEHPRLRLIIPLARTVTAEEYEAIARMIAKDIGIELFDDTTYQPSRLMYWPSTSKDGEYLFEHQEGYFLDPDEVLARYPDWHDVSYWPQSSRVVEIKKSAAKKQGDPLEKDGLIGAFCRTYSIVDAINTFLADVYEPVDDKLTRYTYINGTTAGGLVVYDDKFAYSNHSTDPASGKLCNAFDLVRIHKFGELDDTANEDTPANKLPSYIAMQEFATNDDKAKHTLLKERISAFDEVVVDDTSNEEEVDDSWLEELSTDKKGNIQPTSNNMLIILRNDKRLANLGGFNEFSSRHTISGQLPWNDSGNERIWDDADDAGLRIYIEKVYHVNCPNKLADALVQYSKDHAYHPVRSYLNDLTWDGKERIDTLIIDYLGAEDTRYNRLISRKTLIGAVARIMVPGCKMDNSLILVGRQGLGKSTFIAKLATTPNWTSNLYTFNGKEAFESIRGKWLIELAELAGMKKSEVETIKSFISSQQDTFRGSYKRYSEDHLRQCIFIGSTNEAEFLRDITGNRRFWPCDIGINRPKKSLFIDLDKEVDQIWAEAVTYFRTHEGWFADEELTQLAAEVQESHIESSGNEGIVEAYLNTELPANWEEMNREERIDYFGKNFGNYQPGGVYRDRVCLMEIWLECFQGKPKDYSRLKQIELAGIMKRFKEWEPSSLIRFKAGYGSSRGYRKKSNKE